MISDVLFEAVKEIDRYLVEFSENYEDIREEIIVVRDAMDNLRQKLDTPPCCDCDNEECKRTLEG